MIFSQLESISFTIQKYSFEEISTEIQKFTQEDTKMKFKDGKVQFLNNSWKGREIVENEKVILYLLNTTGQKLFRIKLIIQNGDDFIKNFISGEIRVYQDGDFWIEALLFPKSFSKSKIEVPFEKIDGKLEKYFPISTDSKKFWSGEKNSQKISMY
jgi:hypothetical protein